eukprot:jgi/Hompol1/4155/HPOL_003500-RA
MPQCEQGAIPSHKLFENELVYSFLDINPLSKGHFFHQLPDQSLAALLPAAKKVALALGAENYNLLQNNGRIAHQAVDHVHFHIIPKTNDEGLGIIWDSDSPTQDQLAKIAADIRSKVAATL